MDAYALFTAVQLIAGIASGCELRVFDSRREHRGAEWVSLNIAPNRNQNGAAFKRELISRLLLYGEVLCVMLPDGQRIIAESFARTDDITGDVFSQVSRAGLQINRQYRTDEVLYLTTPTNARSVWLQQVMAMYDKLLRSAATRLKNAGSERGILKVDAVARGKPDFESTFSQLMNDYFKGYFSGKNAVLPLFDGYTYNAQGNGSSGTYTNDLSAVKTLADEAISRAAQAFGIPQSYLRGDAAGIAEAQGVMLTNCIKPLAAMISAELTAKLYTPDEIARGCHIMMDTCSILHHDLLSSAGNVDKLIGAGFSHNEICAAMGQPTSPEKWADEHFITKNYDTIANTIEGSENT